MLKQLYINFYGVVTEEFYGEMEFIGVLSNTNIFTFATEKERNNRSGSWYIHILLAFCRREGKGKEKRGC